MLHTKLKNVKIVLASASPRRRQIFDLLGLKALQVTSGYHEDDKILESPAKLVMRHAKGKAADVCKNMGRDCLVVGADTLVYHNRRILPKPVDEAQATAYLKLLSGEFHHVYTGVAICWQGQLKTAYEKTRVTFTKLGLSQIKDYIKTGEPMDKAGAYGIQGYGSQFIEKLSGCYFNVMGFPVHLFSKMIEEILAETNV